MNTPTVRATGPIAVEVAENACFIECIPLEILRQIFVYLLSFTHEYAENRALTILPSSVAIYQVCQSWRLCVEGMPELWTIIPLQNHLWTEYALLHSDPSAISIHVDLKLMYESEIYRKTVHAALRHTARARNLSFIWIPRGLTDGFQIEDSHISQVQEVLEILEEVQAPLLEYFVFADHPSYFHDLPDDIFCGIPPPRLRHLNLTFITLSTSSPVLSSPLTTLCLRSCPISSDDDPEDREAELAQLGPVTQLETLLAVLRGLPTLKMLTLRGMDLDEFDPDEFDSDTYPRHGVVLPNVEKMVAEGDVNDLGMIFRCLSLPVELNLRIDCAVGHEGEYQPFLPVNNIPIAVMLHDALSNAVDAGLSFRRVHVAFHHEEESDMDVLTIKAFNPRPLTRVRDDQGPAPQPATRMCLTMRHRQQEWLAKDIMGLHAAALLYMIPAIGNMDVFSSDGWDLPMDMKIKMGIV